MLLCVTKELQDLRCHASLLSLPLHFSPASPYFPQSPTVQANLMDQLPMVGQARLNLSHKQDHNTLFSLDIFSTVSNSSRLRLEIVRRLLQRPGLQRALDPGANAEQRDLSRVR